ncbi:hypothetical protein GQ53DRAFT_533591 [Thozetella sp. PMI_491]|nr:hypothetical protein GQ53DRAFT_533591 [Thozetella sp. PMI_491]
MLVILGGYVSRNNGATMVGGADPDLHQGGEGNSHLQAPEVVFPNPAAASNIPGPPAQNDVAPTARSVKPTAEWMGFSVCYGRYTLRHRPEPKGTKTRHSSSPHQCPQFIGSWWNADVRVWCVLWHRSLFRDNRSMVAVQLFSSTQGFGMIHDPMPDNSE